MSDSTTRASVSVTIQTTHARHDPAHCLIPGLFRSFPPGAVKREKLDLTYEFGLGESIRVIGFEPLGAFDLRLLQALVALAGPDGSNLPVEPETDTGRALRVALDLQWEAKSQTTLVVRKSLYRVLQEMGLQPQSRNRRTVKASLLRLSNVTVVIKKGPRQVSAHLLSYAFDDEGDGGHLWAALHPRLASAIVGDHPHTRIDMREVRTIRADPTRLIHQRLCGWIGPGQSGSVGIEVLVGYVWHDDVGSDRAKRKRRSTVRAALKELIALGWGISEYARGKWQIRRPGSPAADGSP